MDPVCHILQGKTVRHKFQYMEPIVVPNVHEGTRWQITIVIPFLTGGNITTAMVLKGKTFTLRGITSH